jgi:LVIVD repeat
MQRFAAGGCQWKKLPAYMKYVLLSAAVLLLTSCYWTHPYEGNSEPPINIQKVWGNKPVYAARDVAEEISYIAEKQPVIQAGNIYAKGNYIFQIDVGRGIHVIDNAVPAQAQRIGFITVNGCNQISIKGNYLYTNSMADLVTLDISDPVHLHEVNRVADAFPELAYDYPLVQPEESGYYLCPTYDSVVVGWVKDSIYNTCFKP